MKSGTKKGVWVALFACCSTLGLSLDLRLASSEGHPVKLFLQALAGYPISQALLFAGLCAIYAYAFRELEGASWSRRDRACILIPAGLFAAFMVVGYSFEQTESLDLVLSGWLQRVKSLVAFGGYFILFSVLIALLYTRISACPLLSAEKKQAEGAGLWSKYKGLLRKHPFRTAFVTMLAAYIPYIILSYPAIFMGDDKDMILQGFNLPSETSQTVILKDENVLLNGHHPISYTMLIHLCLVIGNAVFHSYNAGIFLASMIQLLSIVATASYAISILARRNVRTGALLLLMVHMIGSPRIQNYMFLISKDVPAGCALLLFIISLSSVQSSHPPRRRDVLLCVLSGVALGLLRNDGKYIILGSLVVILLMDRQNRKRWAAAGAAVSLVLVAFFGGLTPALHITPGSKREALSIPFQQTARYFRDYEAEVTEEEWAAVDAVLNAGALKDNYYPQVSDQVKGTYRKTATAGDLAEYFKVWLKMGLKHPRVYVEATMNNYYNYFYPGEELAGQHSYSWGEKCMERTNGDPGLEDLGVSFHYPEKLDRWRNWYEGLREKLFAAPVLSLFKSSALYVWTLLLMVFFFLKEREKNGLALTIPLLFSLLVCLAGPCNGEYYRYLYGINLCLPFVYLLAQSLREDRRGARTDEGGCSNEGK